jgi:hypothetical protein
MMTSLTAQQPDAAGDTSVPSGAGVLAALRPGVDPTWADTILRRDVTGTWTWSASHGSAERQGILTLERPGVRAVTLTPAGCSPGEIRTAARLSARLGQQRGHHGWSPAYLTSPTWPDTPDGLVRIPHLADIHADSHDLADPDALGPGLIDVVVWELATKPGAARWLGTPLPDQAVIEAHLPQLLALRAATRAGRFPPTAAGARLAALVHGRPRPLSIQLVYRHLDLFAELCTEAAEVLAS